MAEITLKQAQEQVDSWIKTYGVRYFNELTNMTILTEEVGELARIMARTYGEQSFKESEKHRDLGDEMADVLWVLLCLANQTGVDLTAAFEKNLQKKTNRDKERHITIKTIRLWYTNTITNVDADITIMMKTPNISTPINTSKHSPNSRRPAQRKK